MSATVVRRFSQVGVAILVLVAMMAAAGARAPSAVATTVGKLAFERYVSGGTYAAYTVGTDGSNLTNISNDPGNTDADPYWSPDGSKVAWTTTRYFGLFQIVIANADGSDLTDISGPTRSQGAGAWSPNGKQIIVHQALQIGVMNLDGTNLVMLTTDGGNQDVDAHWSPDGSKIVYCHEVTSRNYDIVVMNADGSDKISLTTDPAEDCTPSFSPDGSTIYFESTRDGNAHIFRMNSDGSNQTDLGASTNETDSGPSASPDGKQLAYTCNVGSNDQICVMNADGTNRQTLTTGWDQNVEWRPEPGALQSSDIAAPLPPPLPGSISGVPGESCHDQSLVIGVRGSGENPPDTYAPFAFGAIGHQVWTDLSTYQNQLTPYGLPYKAQSISSNWTKLGAAFSNTRAAYYSSERGGVAMLNATLTQAERECPGKQVALIGYSQGAQVIADTLVSLNDTIGDNIRAVVMFGDPRFNGSEPFDYGSYALPRGVLGERPTSALKSYAGRIMDICRGLDPVCQTVGVPSNHDAKAYIGDGYDVDAANFVATKLGLNLIAFSSASSTSLATVTRQSATASTPSVSLPGPPADLQIAAGTDAVTASWTAPLSAPAGGYLCYLVPTSDPTAAWPEQVDSTATGCSFIGLDSTQTYSIEVVATDGATFSAPMVTSTVAPLTNAANVSPTAALTATFGDPATNWILFDGRSSADSDGWIATTHYDFGDGTVADGQGLNGSAVGHTYLHSGTYHVVLTVTDNDGAQATASTDVTVTSDVPAPVTNVRALPLSGSATVSWTAPAVDGNSPVVAYLVTASPGGATSLVTASAGTPATTASIDGLSGNIKYTFTVTAENAVGASPATKGPAITLAVGAPLEVSTTQLAGARVGAVYRDVVSATGGTGSHVWTITGGALPSGLSLHPSGVIGGTPRAIGDYQVTLQVVDSALPLVTQSATFSIVVSPAPLTIKTTSLTGATAGVHHSARIKTSGGTSPVSWNVAAGALPPGMALAPTGVLSGRPLAAGTFTFTVVVSDSGSPTQSAEANLKLIVAPAPPLSISTAVLPNATHGVRYSTKLTATGGVTPVTWTISSGLPPGISLNPTTGVISGKPTTSGTFNLSVQVSDIAVPLDTATATLSLTVQ